MDFARFPSVRVTAVRPLNGYWVWLRFSDTYERELDLWPFISDGHIFEPLHDPDMFRQVRVAEASIAWPNGADIDPLVLRYYPDLKPADFE
jgi:hypothetical protein